MLCFDVNEVNYRNNLQAWTAIITELDMQILHVFLNVIFTMILVIHEITALSSITDQVNVIQ